MIQIKNLHVDIGAPFGRSNSVGRPCLGTASGLNLTSPRLGLIEGKRVLNGVDLQIKPGEIHVIMGPNGSGKSSLAFALMGHPKYKAVKGDILFKKENILGWKADVRARKGIFLSFQHPVEIPGVSVFSFLRSIYGAPNPLEFKKLIKEKLALLSLNENFMDRYMNDGFSGGEKKKMEILQMLILNPSLAILDEPDSGLDVDALKIVAKGINSFTAKNRSVLLITHYQRILRYIKPDYIHIMLDGKIVKSGGIRIAGHLEKSGYGFFKQNSYEKNAKRRERTVH